jgi:hypothetical protein
MICGQFWPSSSDPVNYAALASGTFYNDEVQCGPAVCIAMESVSVWTVV